MTGATPLRAGASLRPLRLLTNTGVAAAYRATFLALRRVVVGRRMSVRVDGDVLELVVTRFASRLPARRLSRGRHHDVRLEARDLVWRGHRATRATVVLRRLHLRGSLRSTELVAASVELTVEVPAPAFDELLGVAAPRLAGDVGPDGTARLYFAGRRGRPTSSMGYVEVRVEVATGPTGAMLSVTPMAVVRRRRWALPARTPSYRIRLPELPHGLQLTSVDFAPGVVRLSGTIGSWRMEAPRLEDVVAQLSVVGRPLSLIWPSGADASR